MAGVSRRLAGAVVTPLAPRRCGRGVQEDQRVPPALEGGVMTPAGAAALAALVNLEVRSFARRVPVETRRQLAYQLRKAKQEIA